MNTPFVQNSIKFIKKNKDIFVMLFVLFIIIPAIGGGKTNLDPKTGKLLLDRAITDTSAWTLKNGLMDFLFVVPIGKEIIYFSKIFKSPIIALGIVAIIIQLLLWIINRKANIDEYKALYIQKELDKYIKENDEKLKKFIIEKNKTKKIELTEEERKEYNELQVSYDKEIEKKKKELYEKNNIKTHSMLLGTVLQLIVLMGVYYATQRTQVIYDYSFFDINLSVKLADGMQMSYQYIILLFVMIATQFLSQNFGNILNTISESKKEKEENNESNKKDKKQLSQAEILTNKIMKIVNCLMIGFIALIGMQFPTVLTVYWILSSFIGIGKTLIERKFIKKIDVVYE